MDSIIFLGHVDHGKSTLAGKYTLMTKHFTDHERESIKVASHVFDQTEERERSKTSETGIEKVDNRTILDAPGHKSYISSAIECISRADVAVIVVSARADEFDTGISKGQTLEHIIISKVYGINSIIVAINKMDTVDWDSDTYHNIMSKISSKLKGKWKEKHIQYVPVSGYTGEGITEHKKEWCSKFPTLTKAIEQSYIAPKKIDDILRLPVANACKIDGKNIVSGRITSGTLHPGCIVTINPINKQLTVSEYNKEYKAGDNVSIEIKNGPFEEIRTGYILSCQILPSITTFHAKVNFLKHSYIISSEFSMTMHCYNLCIPVYVDKILAVINQQNKIEVKEPSFITYSNKTIAIRFNVKTEICVEEGYNFILRTSDYIIGMGKITKTL